MSSTSAQPQRRTAPPEERRRQLMDAAMHVIAQYGLTGTTTAHVARRAGLSVGSISLHFKSKDELLAAVLHDLSEEFRQNWSRHQADPSRSAAEKLASIIEAMFDPEICTPTKIAVWFAFFGDARYRDVYRQIVGSFDISRTELIEDLCQQIRQDGHYDDFDAGRVAQGIESTADGLWLSLMLYPYLLTREEALASLWDMLALRFPRHFPVADRCVGHHQV